MLKKEDLWPKETRRLRMKKAERHMKKAARIFERGRYGECFYGLETYCMFMGYPRSGHTLVGSILDAHPDMVVAHELDAFLYIRLGASREELLSLLMEKSKSFTENGRIQTGYGYHIPGQAHGVSRFNPLLY
jgi:hypothetical protein